MFTIEFPPGPPTRTEERHYVLRHKASGQLLRGTVRSNAGGDFCGDTTTELTHTPNRDDAPVWQVSDPIQAEYVRRYSTPWYNAGYDTPKHDYAADDLEVVERVVQVTSRAATVTIPTPEDFYREHYKAEQPHLDYLLSRYAATMPREQIHPSWYDYQRLRRKLGL